MLLTFCWGLRPSSQRGGDEDSDDDGASDRDELQVGDNPRDADSDHDGIRDGEDNAGTVTGFEATTGVLTLNTAAGMTVIVTDSTEISWHRRSAICPQPATIGDLTTGRVVHKLEAHHGNHHGDDSATGARTAEEIKLVCS